MLETFLQTEFFQCGASRKGIVLDLRDASRNRNGSAISAVLKIITAHGRNSVLDHNFVNIVSVVQPFRLHVIRHRAISGYSKHSIFVQLPRNALIEIT